MAGWLAFRQAAHRRWLVAASAGGFTGLVSAAMLRVTFVRVHPMFF